MPTHDHLPGGVSAELVERFELGYADERGEQRIPLTQAWPVVFEACTPVRGFPSHKGQRHHNGRWWTATTGSLVGCESWLERDQIAFDATREGCTALGWRYEVAGPPPEA